MGDSREASPDWLHSFQKNAYSCILTLPIPTPTSDEINSGSCYIVLVVLDCITRYGTHRTYFSDILTTGSEDNENVKKEEISDNSTETPATMKQEDVQPTEKKTHEPVKMEGEVGNMDIAEENKLEKQTEAAVSSSTLPLILPDKVHRSKAVVECEGESIDLSGDMGAVGRVIISETPSKESEMFLDLKGTIYKTVLVPSRTFCVVSIGQSEAKIEAIMNDFIQLKPQSNVYDAETMVEGTLEGFNFDSDDETDKMTKDVKGDQNEGEEKPNKKTKGKAEKKPAATKKKGKDVGGKQPKKRKPQAPKKGKAKK
uniref:DNA-binding protein BIN4 n=1 Tax=Chenopodium quinoa TaxID=63459 RepID=A0A803MJR7_CHEQI